MASAKDQRDTDNAPGAETPLDDDALAAVGRAGFPWRTFLVGLVFGAALVFAAWKIVSGPPSPTKARAEAPPNSAKTPTPAAKRKPRRPSSDRASTASRPTARAKSASQAAKLPPRADWEIQRKVRESRSAFSACYQAGQANDPTIEGTVTVRFRVESDGSVSQSSVKSSTLNSPTTEKCIAHVISRWRFSSGKRPDTFELAFPFVRQ